MLGNYDTAVAASDCDCQGANVGQVSEWEGRGGE